MSAVRSRAFSPVALRWIAGIASASFLIAVLLTVFAEDLGEPASPGANSFSYSAVGHRALAELLARNGLVVERWKSDRPAAVNSSTALLVAEPPPGLAGRGDDLERFRRALDHSSERGAPVVLVLPKWRVTPDPSRPAWIESNRLFEIADIQHLLAALIRPDKVSVHERAGAKNLDCSPSWRGKLKIRLSSPRLLDGAANLKPIVTCGDGLLVARLGQGAEWKNVYLVSDPDILNNQGLGQAGNATLAAGFFLDELHVSGVTIDETIHGFVLGAGVIPELFRYPLALALAHTFLIAALLVWAGTARFGKIEEPPPPLGSGKEVLIGNASQLMQLAGSTGRSLPSYLDATIRAVAGHYFLPEDAPHGVLRRRLEEIASARGVSIDLAALKRQAERAGRGRRAAGGTVLALAREIHRWKEEMTDVR